VRLKIPTGSSLYQKKQNFIQAGILCNLCAIKKVAPAMENFMAL